MVKALSDYKQAKDLLLDAAAVLSQIAEERSDQGLAQRINIFCNKLQIIITISCSEGYLS